MAKVELSPPWDGYVHKITALFGEDPEIKMQYDENALELKLLVNNPAKAEAIAKLLPTSKAFGNVILKIFVIPSNDLYKEKVETYKAAFNGNPIVSRIETITDPAGADFNYIVFEREVVQYYNDDLGDIDGIHSTLYQEIAKDVFEREAGIYFCTERNKYVTSNNIRW